MPRLEKFMAYKGTMILEKDIYKIAEAAVEDAERYKKDENGQWYFNYGIREGLWQLRPVDAVTVPAAVRAVLEVTGGG